MTQHRLLLTVAVLAFVSAATAASPTCEEDSVLFGSAWKPGSPFYIQEVAWRAYGTITKVNVYSDPLTGCLLGVKATYGWEAMNARRLGVEKLASENAPSLDLKLEKGEVFNKLQYKADSCITYFSLQTNQGRNLTIGDVNSKGDLHTSQPQWPDGFLAYFKGYTDVPNTSASSGKLEQLQLVWSSKVCKAKAKISSVNAAHPDGTAAAAVQKMKAAYMSGLATDTAKPGDASFEQGTDPTMAAETTDISITDDVTGADDAAADADSVDAAELVTSDSATSSDDAQVAIQITEYPGTAGAAGAGAAAAPTQAMVAAAAAAAPAAPQPIPVAASRATVSTTTTSSGTVSGTGSGMSRPYYTGPLPLLKPSDSTPTSTTVVNTTTIITTTTSQKKPWQNGTQYTSQTTTTVSSITAVCKPTTACIDGKCATSSCAINGMGKDVATMQCFGTNLVPNPLLGMTYGNPCANLACKLDTPNCTTTDFGITGFCTGKVVAMGAAAKLHTSGKAFLGYPCVEHRGPMVDLVPIGDYNAKGLYVSKAWKVCDCINGLGLKDGSISIQTPGGGSVTFFPPKFPTLPKYPFLDRPLVNMSLPDVVAQWVAANLADAPVPRVAVNNSVAIQLRKLIPNFTLPSLMLPQISAPLLKVPGNFSLPVFELPLGNMTLSKVMNVLPDMTSLPTLVTPTEPSQILTIKVPVLRLPEITTDTLGMWADSLGVPSMPKLPPVFNMSFSDVLTQWVVANQFSIPVPKLAVPDVSVEMLRGLIPDFQVPSLLILNISQPLLKLPETFPLPVVAIPRDVPTMNAMNQIFPRLNSLPTLVGPLSATKVLATLPSLSLRNITIPNIEAVAVAAGAASPKWFNIPKLNLTLPPLPKLPELNLTLPTVSTASLPPAVLNFSLPGPVLSQLADAFLGLPSGNKTNLPQVLDRWRQQYLTDPLSFDFAGLKNMVTTNDKILPEGIEVSFEVPNVMAQWIAGLVKGAQVPTLEVPNDIFSQLQVLLPDLPYKPSIIVANVSSPYYSPDAIRSVGVPPVVIPDNMLSRVTSLLPDLSLVPQILVPDGQLPAVQINLPAISLESLAAPGFVHTVTQMMAGLQSKAGGKTTQDQVSVSVAAAPAAVNTLNYSSSGTSMQASSVLAAGSPSVIVAPPEPTPMGVQATGQVQPVATAAVPADPYAAAADPNAAAADSNAAVPADPNAAVSADPYAAVPADPYVAAADPNTAAADPYAAVPADQYAAAADPNAAVPADPYAAAEAQPVDADQADDGTSVSVTVEDPEAEADEPAAQAQPVELTTDVSAAAAGTEPGYSSPTWDDSSSDEATSEIGGYESDIASINSKQPESFQEDDEGALLIQGFGPETAFMSPKDFYALDKETQRKFKAMFNL